MLRAAVFGVLLGITVVQFLATEPRQVSRPVRAPQAAEPLPEPVPEPAPA